MISRVLGTGAFTVVGDDLVPIPGKRIIIDKVSYSVQNGTAGALTIDIRSWIQGAGTAFWAKIVAGNAIIDEEVPFNIILKPTSTVTSAWSDGISGYMTFYWRYCNVS